LRTGREMNNLPARRTLADLDMSRPQDLAVIFVKSGLFHDIEDAPAALVKIAAGRELGLGAFTAMQSFDIVEGKLRITSAQLAAWVKASEKYDYRVVESGPAGCQIEWLERIDGKRESIGISSWTDEDRERAGLKLETRKKKPSTWAKYPTAMMFNRALSNGVAMFCPDVVPTGARVYTEGDDFGPADDGYEARVGADPLEPEVLITDDQRTKIMATCRELGIDDDSRHKAMEHHYGVRSVSLLTLTQASDLLARLANVRAEKEEPWDE
jgi:hypothetical protein